MPFVKVTVECPEGHPVRQTTVNPDASSTQGSMMCPICKRSFMWRNEHGDVSSWWR